MRTTSFDSMECPTARALSCIGESWSLLILRDAFQGCRRFDEFQQSLGIPTNTLTRRLFATRGVDDAIEFMAIDIEPSDAITHPVARHVYTVSESRPADAFERMLADYRFDVPYRHRLRCAAAIAVRLLTPSAAEPLTDTDGN